MKILKQIFKVLILLLVISTITSVSLAIYLYLKKDIIIENLTNKVKKELGFEIKSHKPSIEFNWKGPTIGISINKITLRSIKDKTLPPLLDVQRFYCAFNLFNLIKGNYKISQLTIANGDIYIPIFDNKTKNNDKSLNSNLAYFGLDDVNFKNINISILNINNGIKNNIYVNNISAKLNIKKNILNGTIYGKATIKRLKSKDKLYAQNVPINLNCYLFYNLKTKNLNFKNSQITIHKLPFFLNGSLFLDNSKLFDLNIQSNKIDTSHLLEILPYSLSSKVIYLQPKGQGTLNLNLRGPLNKNRFPQISGKIKVKNLSINPNSSTSELNTPIIFNNINSDIDIPNLYNLDLGSVSVEIGKIAFADESMKAKFRIHNLNSLGFDGNFNGIVNCKGIHKLFKNKNFEMRGKLHIDLKIKCQLYNLINKYNDQSFIINGKLETKNLGFYKDKIKIKNINGEVIINNKELKTNDLVLNIFDNEINISGESKNIIDYIFYKNQKLDIKADLSSESISINKWYSELTSNSKHHFSIPKKWNIILNCNVSSLSANKFIAKNINSKIILKKKKISIIDMSMILGGGKTAFNGQLDMSNGKRIISATANLKKVKLDELFIMFNNFGQKFITSKNIKGDLFSDLKLTLNLRKNLKPKWNSLDSTIEILVNNGELIKFKPLKHVSDYIDKDDLEKINFTKLKNTIKIKNSTVFIPEMEVPSSITTLKISGHHKFDNTILYNFILPLRKNFKKKNTTDLIGKLKTNDLSGLRLFLKLEGPVEKYKVSYSITNSLAKELKKQTKEIGKLIIGKYKKEKDSKNLSQNEYFDFD